MTAAASGATKDFVLRAHEVSPFMLDLPTRGAETRVDLSFRQGHLRVRRNGVVVQPLVQTAGTTWSRVPDVCPLDAAGASDQLRTP